jgi:hypothetical protein
VCVASLALNKGGAEMINFRNSSIALSDFAASAPMQIRKQATLGFFALLGSAGAANNTSSHVVCRARIRSRGMPALPAENHLCVKGKLTFRSRLKSFSLFADYQFHSAIRFGRMYIICNVTRRDARIPKCRNPVKTRIMWHAKNWLADKYA